MIMFCRLIELNIIISPNILSKKCDPTNSSLVKSTITRISDNRMKLLWKRLFAWWKVDSIHMQAYLCAPLFVNGDF